MHDPHVMATVRTAIETFARVLDEALTERARMLRTKHCETEAERAANEAAADVLDAAAWAAIDARRTFLEITAP